MDDRRIHIVKRGELDRLIQLLREQGFTVIGPRVREGALDAADLALLYVDLDDQGAAFVRRLEVDDDGDLVDGWPGGFFDERLAEVLPGLGAS